jgi:site-specific DNA recombinase
MSTPPPGSGLIAYVRDSGGGEQELSIIQQQKAIQDWAVERGLHIRNTFKDEGRSATGSAARPGLQDMLAYFRTKPPEAGVIVWKLDRFSRNLNEAQLYSAELRMLGYHLYSISDNLMDGPEGAIYETLLHYANEQYSRSISAHVTRGQNELFRLHGALGGTPPRGFRHSAPIMVGFHRNGKERIVHRWEPDPDLVPLIRRAFELRAINLPYDRIQAEVPLYKSKNCWPTFFANPLYKGTMVFANQVVENYCEPIVSPELWEKVQQVHTSRKERLKSGALQHPRRTNSLFLLSGLVYCQVCGAPMYSHVIVHAKRNQRRDYYACTRRNRRRDCPSVEVPRMVLETSIMNEIENHILSLEFMLMVQTSQQTEQKRTYETLQSEYELTRQDAMSAHRKLVNLVEALSARPNSPALLSALDAAEIETANLDARIVDLQKQLEPHPIYANETLTELADQLRAALTNENTRRETARSLVHRVLVKREGTELQIYAEFYSPQSVCIQSGAPGRTHSVYIQTHFKLYQRLKST